MELSSASVPGHKESGWARWQGGCDDEGAGNLRERFAVGRGGTRGVDQPGEHQSARCESCSTGCSDFWPFKTSCSPTRIWKEHRCCTPLSMALTLLSLISHPRKSRKKGWFKLPWSWPTRLSLRRVPVSLHAKFCGLFPLARSARGRGPDCGASGMGSANWRQDAND